MPPRKRQRVGSRTADAERLRLYRQRETDEEREIRNRANRERTRMARIEETEEEIQTRNTANRERTRMARNQETEEQRLARTAADRQRTQLARNEETEERRLARTTANRERTQLARNEETEEEKLARIAADRERTQLARNQETEEERLVRIAANRERTQLARNEETEEQRLARIAANSKRTQLARNEETEERRLARIAADRERTQLARNQETEEERLVRIAANRERTQLARNEETEEQRLARIVANRERTQLARNEETEEQRLARIAANRERTQLARNEETEERRLARIAADREQTQLARNRENEEERLARIVANRERTQLARNRETEEQRLARIAANRERTRLARNEETQEENENRLLINRFRNMGSRSATDLVQEGFRYNPQTDYSNHPKVTIGSMDSECRFCKAKKFKAETAGMCCGNGKVVLPEMQPIPDALKALMSGTTPISKHFLRHIRKYNACFQMTSFGVTAPVNQPGFPTTFTIQGQVYHSAGSLLPPPGQPSKFLQIYFMGNDDLEVNRRCENIPGVRREIVAELQTMFHEVNELVRTFKTSLDRMPSDEYKVVIKADRRPHGEHRGRYNEPQVNEIAVIISREGGEQRDITLEKRSNSLQRISETHRSYDALQYPVMFPTGEDGFHLDIPQVNPSNGEPVSKKVTAMAFYAYRLMIRCSGNHLLNCRRLFQQFVVDECAKIESGRLLFIRMNQKKLRSESYIHLRDAIARDGNVQNIGRLTILPSTFTGSPRQMHEYTQDAMTYVRTYGRPDLFITFTCNPLWSEIEEMLEHGQSASDRPDIIARVFRQKLIKLIDVLTKCQLFGTPQCWMYTVEYQKRGLPHAHILIWLKNKIQPSQIDEVISAELPDPENDPELHAIIVKHMVHGPCGRQNPRSPCMKDNKCSKRYPRDLIEATQSGNDGYPKYRRRSPQHGGATARVTRNTSEIQIDNSWIVPHSPVLSKMFEAHINVEYCNSVKSIKYVCKYVNKGSDMAAFGLTSDGVYDEVSQYQLGRYISSSEAIWRILGFPIHERYPAVMHLSVHLEDGQRVHFTSETAVQTALQPPHTTLTAFFELCREDAFARTLLYSEVPKYYTFNTSSKKFCKRRAGQRVPGHADVFSTDTLGRVYTVHPNNAECFYLRMLLHTIKGPTSFEQLKTVDGRLCQSYREACQELGLLEDDQHWERTMQEAQVSSMPEQLRVLFAIILTTCSPSNPISLWEKFRDSMSEDILHSIQQANPQIEIAFNDDIFNLALIRLEDICLNMNGKKLSELGMISPPRDQGDNTSSEYLRETTYNVPALETYIDNNLPLLNADQKLAHDYVLEQVERQEGKIIFLDAPGGTGKTFLVNLILAQIRKLRKVALAIASSGIAATLMEGGRTAHAALKLPLDIARHEAPTCNISKRSGQARVLQECQLIVWDECTMAHKKSLDALDLTLKDLRDNDRLMGGTVLLLCGDFRQTLPVVPQGTPVDEINACLKQSVMWSRVHTIRLRQNMRIITAGNQSDFAERLLEIGEGRLRVNPSGNIMLSPDLFDFKSTTEELINAVYPDISENVFNHDWLRERAILAPRNEDVDSINSEVLEKLPGSSFIYSSIDSMADADSAVYYPIEFLHSLNPPGMPPHTLKLKIGCPIILLRNLNPPILCNGTRLCVTKFTPNIIEAIVLTGRGKGETVFIPRIPLIPSELPFTFKRLQFPVKLAFSVTINKAQGQSLKYCGVNLKFPCFSHGQLYVALSRVGSSQNLFIYAPNQETKNIVHTEVLN